MMALAPLVLAAATVAAGLPAKPQAADPERTVRAAAVRRFRVKSFIVPKPREPGEGPEDAVAHAAHRGLYAIADGVSLSDFPGPLARSLVKRWVLRPAQSRKTFPRWLLDVQADWNLETGPQIQALEKLWYNQGHAWRAASTFVGAHVVRGLGGLRLRLMGMGDSVAFLIRGGELERSFPLEEADEFSNVTKGLTSHGPPAFKVRDTLWDLKAGDEIVLATDALAHWILRESEAGRDPFAVLRGIHTLREMTTFVRKARAGRLEGRAWMNTDDTSFLRFVVPPTEPAPR